MHNIGVYVNLSGGDSTGKEKNDAYMEQLKGWADWERAHIKVKSIFHKKENCYGKRKK